MALLSTRTWKEWIGEYSLGHRHPVNRACHMIGIPLIAISILLFFAALFASAIASIAIALFVLGWILQFVGHAYEGKPPEFLKDWRFLFVGLRWWFTKLRGRR
jgi:uncharacterized membrane protein YGL010W